MPHGRRLILGIAATSIVLFLAAKNDWARFIGQGGPTPACADGADNDGDNTYDAPGQYVVDQSLPNSTLEVSSSQLSRVATGNLKAGDYLLVNLTGTYTYGTTTECSRLGVQPGEFRDNAQNVLGIGPIVPAGATSYYTTIFNAPGGATGTCTAEVALYHPPDLGCMNAVDNDETNAVASPCACSNRYTYDGNAFSLLSADMNGDGKKDLISGDANKDINTNAWAGKAGVIFLGNGDGTFGPPKTIALSGPFLRAVNGDFDKDGKQDLVVLNYQRTYSTFLKGRGDGTFANPVEILNNYTGPADAAHDIETADFTGDGYLDLLLSKETGIWLYKGKSGGSFDAPSVVYTGSAFIEVADFNKDGKADFVFAARQNSSALVFIGKGNGTFEQQSEYVTMGSGQRSTYATGIGDVNGDTYPDIVMESGNGHTVYVNKKDGTFENGKLMSRVSVAQSLLIADINGDRKGDVIEGGIQTNTIATFMGNGNGTFPTAPSSTVDIGFGSSEMVSDDFNGDGKPDLAIVNGSIPYQQPIGVNFFNGITVLLNVNGTFSAATGCQLSQCQAASSSSSSAYQTALQCSAPIRTPVSDGTFGATATVITTAQNSPVYYTTTAKGLVIDRTNPSYSQCNGKAMIMKELNNNFFLSTLPWYDTANTGGDYITNAYCNPTVSQTLLTNKTQTTTIKFVVPNTTTPINAEGSTIRFDFTSKGSLGVQNHNFIVQSYDPQNKLIETFNLQPPFQGGEISQTLQFTKGIVQKITIQGPILAGGMIDNIAYTAISCPECDDNADNDGDTLKDFPGDPGCTSAADTKELKECSDGMDNDGDGKFDIGAKRVLQKTVTSVGLSDREDAPTAIVYNVVEGQTITFDLGGTYNTTQPCSNFLPNIRGQFQNSMGDPVERDLVGAELYNGTMAAPKYANRLVVWFVNLPSAGFFSCTATNIKVFKPQDPGCTDVFDNSENSALMQCQDGLDNDGDGAIDAAGTLVAPRNGSDQVIQGSVTNDAFTALAQWSSLVPGETITFSYTKLQACPAISTLRGQFRTQTTVVGPVFSGEQARTATVPSGATHYVAWLDNAYSSGSACKATNVKIYKANDLNCTNTLDNDETGPLPSSASSSSSDSSSSISSSAASVPIISSVCSNQSTVNCKATYPIARGAMHIHATDLNGDGKKDLVTSNYFSNDVSVSLNYGNGSFAPAVNFPAGNAPYAIASGDFTEDGKKDLVLTNYQASYLTLLKGNGNGSFAEPIQFATNDVSGAQDILAGDFDSDNYLDVVAADNVALRIFNGKQGDSFDPGRAIYAFLATGWLAGSDVNKDGNMDLAVTTGHSSGGAGMSIFIIHPDGSYSNGGTYNANFSNKNSLAIAAGDLTGDGYDDIVVSENGSQRSVYINKGDGTFNPVLATQSNTGARSLEIADINGDGKNDLIEGTHMSTLLKVFYGNGDGTFPNTPSASLNIDHAVNDIAVADFNGDGKPDAAAPHGEIPYQTTNFAEEMTVLMNTNGGFSMNGSCTVVMSCTPSSPSSSSSSTSPPSSSSSSSLPRAECNDSTDNDGDGASDFPGDFSCANAADNDETLPLSACQDSQDNDADGLIDTLDSGCRNKQDNSEISDCEDGLDNDQDGVWDMADPGCSAPSDADESDEVCKEPSILFINLQPAPFPQNSTPAAVADMEKEGYSVTYHTTISLTDLSDITYLRKFDVVWLHNGCGKPESLLGNDELAAIKTYVEGGGNMVLSPGDFDLDTSMNTDDCTSRINQIGSRVGLSYEGSPVASNGCMNATSTHPLGNGVTKLQGARSATLSVMGAPVWNVGTMDVAATFATSDAVAITQKKASAGRVIGLKHSNILKPQCNDEQAYRNIFGILGMRKDCACPMQNAATEGQGFLAFVKRLWTALLPSRLVGQTTPTTPASCAKTQCNDGIDNDSDGLIDLTDPGCFDSADKTEQNTVIPLTSGSCVIASQDTLAGDGNFAVKCPAGYAVVGGGWKEYRFSDLGIQASYPLNDRSGWECSKDVSLKAAYSQSCAAICCRTDVIESSITSVTAALNSHPLPQCTATFTVTGGGFNDKTVNKDEETLRPENENTWHCYDDDSTATDSMCYAVCSRLADARPLQCETVIVEKMNGDPVRVDCPDGTTIMGGGFDDTSTGNDDEESSGPYDNGWTCWEDNSDSPLAMGICYARCCEIPEPKGTTVTAKITSPPESTRGATASFALTLKNTGEEAAVDAFIRHSVHLTGATLVSLPSGCSTPNVVPGLITVECHHAALAANAERTFTLSYVISGTTPCTPFVTRVVADAFNAAPSTSVTTSTTVTGCQGSSSSTSSSSAISTSSSSSSSPSSSSSSTSSSSAISTSSSSSSSAGTLACTYNGCLSGGAEFCSAGGELCQSAPQSPCFRCGNPGSGGSSAGTQQCTFNGCDRGGSGYCSLRGQGCQASLQSPCFTCGGTLPPSSRSSARSSSSSSSIETACTFNGCDRGGSAFCSAGGELCQSSPQSPCFQCAATLSAASSSSAQQCAFDGCLRGGTSFCRLQGLGCSVSLRSPCFSCSGAASSVSSNEPPSSEGSFCTEDLECRTGLCKANICTGCTQANDCADGFVCLDHACVDASALAFSAPESPKAACGNGVLDQEEECEDGNTQDGDDCSAECLFENGRCGDDIVQRALGEQCDGSAQTLEGAICTPRCTLILRNCGNGLPDPGEECDEGNRNSDGSGATCRRNCSVARCGDGVMDPGERCDDGNRLNGDGCDRACAVESGTVGETLAQTAESPHDQQPYYPLAILWPSARNAGGGNDSIVGSATTATLPVFVAPAHPPVGETGPATVAVMAAGAAAGIGWVRKKKRL